MPRCQSSASPLGRARGSCSNAGRESLRQFRGRPDASRPGPMQTAGPLSHASIRVASLRNALQASTASRLGLESSRIGETP